MLLDLSLDEINEYVVSLGWPKFRGKQLFDAILNGKQLAKVTNLPEKLKKDVEKDEPNFEITKKLVAKDGTTKYVFKMKDGNLVESVLMKYVYGLTLCVSTQVGCRMGCKFCASTLNGLVRNLSAGEILQQVVLANRDQNGSLKKRAITNIVLMGMGEPFDNYDEVTKFLKLVTNKDGFNISQRNITISTCGIEPMIYKLADDGFSVNLTISLHATSDEKRKKIMPIANAFSIEKILKACNYYFEKTGRRIGFEYTLIEGENDSFQEADKLANLLKGMPCHVNVISLNPVKERSLKGTDQKKAYAFVKHLNEKGISATKRRTMGDDVGGACGQLRSSLLEGS